MAATNNASTGTSPIWTTASNWSLGHAPTTNESTFLTGIATNFTSGLNQAAVVLTVLNQDMSFTGAVGVNNFGVSGGTNNTYLQIAAPISNWGLPSPTGSGTGSRTLLYDAGTNNSVINVVNTANSGAIGAPLKLLCAAGTINFTNGVISVAAAQNETSTINTFSVVAGTAGVSPQAYLGPGVNLTTLVQNAGQLTSASQSVISSATITGAASSYTHTGTGGFSNMLIANSAKVSYIGYGSINGMTLGGTFDCSGGGEPFTIASITLTLNARLNDPLRRIIFTNPPVLLNVSYADIFINRGITGGGAF